LQDQYVPATAQDDVHNQDKPPIVGLAAPEIKIKISTCNLEATTKWRKNRDIEIPTWGARDVMRTGNRHEPEPRFVITLIIYALLDLDTPAVYNIMDVLGRVIRGETHETNRRGGTVALAEKMPIPATSSVPNDGRGGGAQKRKKRGFSPWIAIGGQSKRSRSRFKKKRASFAFLEPRGISQLLILIF
jgi:hypothetical protein